MESQKYLVIITIIDGQNFTVPDGSPERVEATVFAEARFGKESILRSDPVKLNNSNPEFVTELAWQLDRKSLHQLRVERRAIKLQVFMQTRERRKSPKQGSDQSTTTQTNGWSSDKGDTHKVELIGYTILDLRSAGPKDQPKFQWLPLLNPKFRKSSYNRPELQLAITMTRLGDETNDVSNQPPSMLSDSSELGVRDISLDSTNGHNHSTDSDERENSGDTRLFTTCLETTVDNIQNDEIIDNDIIIRSRDGRHWVYDANHPQKSTIEDCKELYTIDINIPFGTGLELLEAKKYDSYYFAIKLFGTIYKTETFKDLTFAKKSCGMEVAVATTHSGALATYFELNSDLDIKLYSDTGEALGVANVQLNQLCSLDMKCRSIEGIFAMQPLNDNEQETDKEVIHPSIGLSIVLEKDDGTRTTQTTDKPRLSRPSLDHIKMAKMHFGEEIDDFLYKSMNDTHHLTLDATTNECDNDHFMVEEKPIDEAAHDEIIVEDLDGPRENDHHYCFTIDLKEFTYTSSQRLIPTLRELVIRYSYPFFGYKDTITTDASMPVSTNSSIIVSGFCEFNFATTIDPLLTALREIPLNLEIFAFDDSRLVGDYQHDNNEKVATCDIILAEVLGLNDDNINQLKDNPLNQTASLPIYSLDGNEIGQLQIYLCLKDLGPPTQLTRSSIDNLNKEQTNPKQVFLAASKSQQQIQLSPSGDMRKIDAFISETKKNFESWKDDYFEKLSDEIHRKDTERFKRLYQRIEAKESKRDQEFRSKIEEFNKLERRFKGSLACVENLEKMLADSVEQMKIKNAVLDAKLDMVDLKISQVMMSSNANHKEAENNKQSTKATSPILQQSFDEYVLDQRNTNKPLPRVGSEKYAPRRSSLRNPLTATTNNNGPGIPVPIRSSSLVRGPVEETNSGSTSSHISPRTVKRGNVAVNTTVINGLNSRVRSNSARLNLSKETQEKLINLRKQKAELLKRGCKPTDDLIQEINSIIDKLAC